MERLIDDCLRGEARAWSRFVDRYGPLIVATVRRVLAAHSDRVSACDVEDTVQEVFVKLVRDRFSVLRRFDPARASLETWLRVVSRSVAIDGLRRRSRQEAVLVADSDRVVEPALGMLPETGPEVPRDLLSHRQQLVLHLMFDRDLEVADVATLLGIEPQTVRSTKHKALARLRVALGVGA